MKRRRILTFTMTYWKPGEDYLERIISTLEGRLREGDVIAVSEKAVSTATRNIVDESLIRPSRTARFLAGFWTRCVWGYVLGPLCRLRKTTIGYLRKYPSREGSAHKQVALQQSGFLQALTFGSEGGIDGSNLPYSYVSLPLEDACLVAETIREALEAKLGENVAVIIVDSDKTYSWRNFHFTPRPRPMKGIESVGGFIAYVVGRILRLKRRATPLAVAGANMTTEEALEIANVANRARGFGAGRTVWDMAETFGVPLTGVTWEMLEKTQHRPVVIVRAGSRAKDD